MPQDLRPGVLYVSEEFGAAAHLCACGCGEKVSTPLGPTEWSLEETGWRADTSSVGRQLAASLPIALPDHRR